ncbi:hypothetical protein IGI57_002517 [Enterococcus sp. DIV0213j]|jgi:hypothetical protein|uniref:hypothetical protein n=1 Tax=Enterococcus sp. DIV0213j TaxID=2774649 RepID=UPI003D2DF073
MAKNMRIDSDELSALSSQQKFTDEKTMELFEQIKSVVEASGASYDQSRKALIMVDRVSKPEPTELTIDPELPEKLKTELYELSKEFFNKVLAVKKELLPSMKEEELAFLCKKLSKFRRELPSDGIDVNFHIGQIMTDATLITFSDENLESSD